MRNRHARGIECGRNVERIHALPRLRIAFGDRLVGKSAGNVDQHVEPAEMRRRVVDRLFRRCGVGQVDAAEFELV